MPIKSLISATCLVLFFTAVFLAVASLIAIPTYIIKTASIMSGLEIAINILGLLVLLSCQIAAAYLFIRIYTDNENTLAN